MPIFRIDEMVESISAAAKDRGRSLGWKTPRRSVDGHNKMVSRVGTMSTGCKWSRLNAPGYKNLRSHPFLELGEFPFLIIRPLGNKNGLPSMKVQKLKIYQNKSDSTGCKWPSLNASGTETPLSHQFLELGEIPFLIISPLG